MTIITYILITLLLFILIVATPVLVAYYRYKTKYDTLSIKNMLSLEKKIVSHETLSSLFDPMTLKPYDRAILERKVTDLWFSGHLKDYKQGMEMDYIVRGYLIPYNSMAHDLKIFDNSRPKKDIQKFIRGIADKCDLSDEDVIRRIREVRRISKYLVKNKITERVGLGEG